MKQKHKVQMVALAHAKEEYINRSPLKTQNLIQKQQDLAGSIPTLSTTTKLFLD